VDVGAGVGTGDGVGVGSGASMYVLNAKSKPTARAPQDVSSTSASPARYLLSWAPHALPVPCMSKMIAYKCPLARVGGLWNRKEYQFSPDTDVDVLARLNPVGPMSDQARTETVTVVFEGSVSFRSTLVSVPLIPAVKVCPKGWVPPAPVVQVSML
jgi:hypothetical protein